MKAGIERSRPRLRGVFFGDRPPVGGKVVGGKTARLEIDQGLLPNPRDPVRLFITACFEGMFGSHTVELKLVDETGAEVFSAAGTTSRRDDQGREWNSWFEVVFLPLRPQIYRVRISIDGHLAAERDLPVVAAPGN